MDEVFGNSSTETVISVHDLETKEQSKGEDPSNSASPVDSESPSPPEARCKEDDSTTNKQVPCQEERGHSTKHEQKETDEVIDNPQLCRVSVIKCATSSHKSSEENVFKVPVIPPAHLRHTQSAVSQKLPAGMCTRARSHSTSANANDTFLKHHPYQNIPPTSSSLPHISSTTASYVNIPESFKRARDNTTGSESPSKRLNITNSAPSTPRGSRNPVSPRVNSSYIQLWTGIKQVGNPSGEDSLQTIPGTGYVSMSSPYVRSPNSSILSDLANQFSSVDPTTCKELFCPFCPRPFSQEQNLKHHIQAIHRHELQKIAFCKDSVVIQYCPFCHGRFFNPDLLPSHLLEFHRDSLVDIFDKHESVRSEGKIRCPFCIKKVPDSELGEEILLYHVLQLHSVEYESLIRTLFKPVECIINRDSSLTRNSIEDLAGAFSFKPGVTSTPGLSLKFNSLTCRPGSVASVNSEGILEETWSSHCAARADKKVESQNQLQSQTVNKGILRSQTDLSRKPSVKRELRFSVPPVTSEEVFIPESPESSQNVEEAEQDENDFPHPLTIQRQNIPIRVDSLSSADFIELNNLPDRKRRRLGLGLKSKKSFKKKKKETSQLVDNVFDGLKSIGCGKSSSQHVVATSAVRTFRKPKPVPPPTVPPGALSTTVRTVSVPPPPSQVHVGPSGQNTEGASSEEVEASPFGNMKLYSPLRMFRCNSCRVKFCDNESLGSHIRSRHRGFLGLLRPQFGCGICSAKFYENKYLVKHCLQHHTSLLEIRSPKPHKITIYRFSKD